MTPVPHSEEWRQSGDRASSAPISLPPVSLEMTQQRVRLECPSEWVPADRLRAAASGFGVRAQIDVSDGMARVDLSSDAALDVDALFAAAHGYPRTPQVALEEYVRPARPLVSCIILLTANDVFVRRHLLPGLVQCSREAEIIVVYNGPPWAPTPDLGTIPVLRSDFAAVARGYNFGVAAARGEYVALFHDDVLLWDPHWIDRCLRVLQDGFMAVTPELQAVTVANLPLTVAKGVPLVMKRTDYELVGGHDEFYLLGLEDLDFTQSIIARGGRVEAVSLQTIHFNGMSTVAALGSQPRIYRRLFGHHMIDRASIRELQGRTLLAGRKTAAGALSARYLAHFLEKHRGLLADDRILEDARSLAAASPPMSELVKTYRAMLQPEAFTATC